MNARPEGTELADAAAALPGKAVIGRPASNQEHHSTRGIAQALRDEGFEVTCTVLDQAPEQMVAIAIAQNAPPLQPAVHSATPLRMAGSVLQRLKQEAAGAAHVVVGGIVPAAGNPALETADTNSMLEWAC